MAAPPVAVPPMAAPPPAVLADGAKPVPVKVANKAQTLLGVTATPEIREAPRERPMTLPPLAPAPAPFVAETLPPPPAVLAEPKKSGVPVAAVVGGLAGVDTHQHIALLHRLPGIGLHFQHAAGHLRPDRRLLDGLDHGLRRKGQIDGMRLDGNDRQGLGNSTGRQRQAQYESGENIHVHKYKHTLIY